MRNHAVVLTYPDHYLLTTLTIRSIRKFFPEVKDITVLVDDISPKSWSTYISDCEKLYQTTVIPLSQYRFLQPFAENGWIRQQIVKLHLDSILEQDRYFFTDGDIGFTSHIPFGIVPHGYISADQSNADRGTTQDSYIRDLLGVAPIDQWYKNERMCTSVAAFRDLDLTIIKSLREYIEKRFGVSFIETHIDIMKNTRYTISEWELIEAYRLNVLHQEINWFFCPPRNYSEYFVQISPAHPVPYFYTCFGSDADFGQDWWNQVNNDFF